MQSIQNYIPGVSKKKPHRFENFFLDFSCSGRQNSFILQDDTRTLTKVGFSVGIVSKLFRLGVAGHTLFDIPVVISGAVIEIALRNLHSSQIISNCTQPRVFLILAQSESEIW